jgi:hypothetical protein
VGSWGDRRPCGPAKALVTGLPVWLLAMTAM